MVLNSGQTRALLRRGLLAWLLFPVAAVLNGFVRDTVILPRLGNTIAEVFGAVVLLAVVYGVAALLLHREPSMAAGTLWLLGFVWAGLAVAFEFVLFGVVLGVPTGELLAAYNVFAGRLWGVVVIGVLLAPPLVGRWMGHVPEAT